jgi:hypothetical protein
VASSRLSHFFSGVEPEPKRQSSPSAAINVDVTARLVLGHGLWAKLPDSAQQLSARPDGGLTAGPRLPALLSQVLLAFAIEFERESDVSLAIERLVGEPSAGPSPLFAGLKPYEDGWRASVRTSDTLPHYPMVLHRGGYPDGS